MGEGGLDCAVETFDVDLLHEAEAFEGGMLDGGPPRLSCKLLFFF